MKTKNKNRQAQQKANYSRRELLLRSGSGLAAYTLLPVLGTGRPLAFAQERPNPAEERFFIQVFAPGGCDATYSFDARPLPFTEQGILQNYLGEEPSVWLGSSQGSTLATSLVNPLIPFRDLFSVCTGVHMDDRTDGHLESSKVVFSGRTTAADMFVPWLNQEADSRKPLDFLHLGGPTKVTFQNDGGGLSTDLAGVQTLREVANRFPAFNRQDPFFQFVRSESDRLSLGDSHFAKGANALSEGLSATLRGEVANAVASLAPLPSEQSSFEQQLFAIKEFFRTGLCSGAVLVIEGRFDAHDETTARAQPVALRDVFEKLATLFRFLANNSASGDNTPLIDQTTVLFTSEFSRTFRQQGKPVTRTGTDHNRFNNVVLLGGRGVRGGQVFGASDCDALGDNGELILSGAHRNLDPTALFPMGKPFDFAQGRVRTDLPNEYRRGDYLTYRSVLNTLFTALELPESRLLPLTDQERSPAPILRQLLT